MSIDPVVVKALIYDDAGRMLLQHRDNTENIIEPNKWSLFGGGVEWGESLVDALARELREELSCEIGVIESELFRWIQLPENSLHVCFLVRATNREAEILLTEGQGFGWFTLSEMMKLSLGVLVSENISHLSDFIKENKF